MHRKGYRYETCRVCGQEWSVSVDLDVRPGEYVCWRCAGKEKRKNSELAMRLRQLRERRRVASYVVSELCGLGHDTLRRYEQGQQVPGADALRALADYYEVSVDWLLGRD